MIYLLIAVLSIHVILSIVILVLCTHGKMRLRKAAMPFVFLCVLFGPLCAFFFQKYKLKHGDSADIDVPKFKIEKEIYRSLGFVEEDNNVIPLEEALVLNSSDTRRSLMMDLVKESVVPLEEALTLSSSGVRRKLMMDVLNSNTAAFYDLLEQARLNDDTEVVHYATTAMSELGKKYDVMLERYEKKYQENPDNLQVLYDYCACFSQYLDLGMLTGQILNLRRGQYIDLLTVLLQKQPTMTNYCDLSEQLMKAERFSEADLVLKDMEERWPSSEEAWNLRLEFYARQKNGEAVNEMVQKALREHIYFSAKTRDVLAFWLGHGIHESGDEEFTNVDVASVSAN